MSVQPVNHPQGARRTESPVMQLREIHRLRSLGGFSDVLS
ncbi:MAG: hypothetical protein QOH41_994 [Blastocatellia bacterium]|jgi:hypothetical protein|nr:hypothetical protein [Blastocatellia bacterium]